MQRYEFIFIYASARCTYARFLLYFRQFLHMDTPTNGTDGTDFILLYKPKKLEKNDYCFIVLRTSNLRSDNLFLNRFNITYPTKASLQRVIKQQSQKMPKNTENADYVAKSFKSDKHR